MGDCTVKENKLNFFIYNWVPGGNLNDFDLKNTIKSANISGANNEKVTFENDRSGWIIFHLPLRKKDHLIVVLEFEIEGIPEVDDEF